jgi:hypothetical protein
MDEKQREGLDLALVAAINESLASIDARDGEERLMRVISSKFKTERDIARERKQVKMKALAVRLMSSLQVGAMASIRDQYLPHGTPEVLELDGEPAVMLTVPLRNGSIGAFGIAAKPDIDKDRLELQFVDDASGGYSGGGQDFFSVENVSDAGAYQAADHDIYHMAVALLENGSPNAINRIRSAVLQ